jgi:hypothetical protein
MLVDPDLRNPNKRIFSTVAQARAALTPNMVEYFMREHDKIQAGEGEEWYQETSSTELKRAAAIFDLDPTQDAESIFDQLQNIAMNRATSGD